MDKSYGHSFKRWLTAPPIPTKSNQVDRECQKDGK
jgi:hypothetical protein